MLYVGQGMVIEAYKGVIMRSLSDALGDVTYAMVMRNTQVRDPSVVVDYAFSKLGSEMDYWGMFTHPRFGVWVASTVDTTDKYTCSKLVTEAFEAGGAPLILPASWSSPSDFPSFGFLEGVEYIGTLLQEQNAIPLYFKNQAEGGGKLP